MREPSWSLVPTAKCGLSSVGPCHHNSLSGPPPRRLVGLYSDFVCARAARMAEPRGRQRPGQPDRQHSLHEVAAREFAALNVPDQTSQCMLVHRPLRMPRLIAPRVIPDKNATCPSRTGCRETVNGSPIGAASQLRRIVIVEVEERPPEI